MSNAKKTETTEQTNLAKSTKIVAIYAGRGINNKEGSKNFGKKFYKYNLEGPASEIKEFIEHPANQEYGVKYNSDGKPQYWCNWKDAFGTIGTRYNVRVSIYGTYVLDKEESYDIEDTLQALEEKGLNNAARVYAEHIFGSRLGLGLNKDLVNRHAEKVSDGSDAKLDQ